jgi:HAD superfamily hydrolase (TIGR01509 family)
LAAKFKKVRINVMKTILVDAINGLVLEDGSILESMHKLLESYPNPKIVLTGANDEQFNHFKLDQVPYEVFTLKHNPEKTDPQYFKILLKRCSLTPNEVVYFEHNVDAVKSAQSVGITTYFYDHTKEDMDALKQFLDENLNL